MVKIILADDHHLVRKGLRTLLETLDFVEVVGEAANGKEVVSLLRGGAKPDVVVLDYEMPMMNGLETAAVIQREFFGVKTIMLTMLQQKTLVEDALAQGVRGFLFKDAALEEFEQAIRRVAQGDTYFASGVTMAILRPTAAPDADLLAQLSDREVEILTLIAQGLSSTAIGEKLFISPRTVDTHRNNIIQKLGVHGIAGLTQFALRNKLVGP